MPLEGVDTKHDIESVGIYSRKGKLYLDKTAAKELSPKQVREVVIHERIEHSLRTAGKSYLEAHKETQRLFPFAVDTKRRIHNIANRIQKLKMQGATMSPPGDAMFVGAINPMSMDEIEEYDPDQLRTAVDAVELRKRRKQIAEIRGRIGNAGVKAEEFMSDFTQQQLEKREAETQRVRRLDLTGRNLAKQFEMGTSVAKATKKLACTNCSAKYKVGDRVFKRLMQFYCPRCGKSLGEDQSRDPFAIIKVGSK